MNSYCCTHVKEYKKDKIQLFKHIHAVHVACISKQHLIQKARECCCTVCKTKSNRLHACLTCTFIACYNGHHIHDHFEVTGHNLAIDITFGTVYCFICGDYMYDPDLEAAAKSNKRDDSRLFTSWEPSAKEVELLKSYSDRWRVVNGSFLGLRGLVNLKNTCFMSCILQVLIHTPLLRDYFFAEKHVCHFNDDPSMCLVCEMSNLYQEFYSGENTPYIPYRLLYLVWTHAKHLSGYEQQDAHEFFIAALDLLHLHCKGINGLPNGKELCNCIIDQIFTGLLQSDVICSKCNTLSPTVDPFWDISLDLGTNSHNSGSSEAAAAAAVDNSEPTSLISCLERFTHPEKLSMRTCDTCQSDQEATKQLTMKKLPIVASFHLKRLEHSARGRKNTTFISFPEYLDMTPFISSNRRESSSNGDSIFSGLSESDNKFSLYAVVNHKGNKDGGHYISFIRQYRNNWFKCDDHSVKRATVEEVLQSEGYLLFYHKQILEYEKKKDDAPSVTK